MEQQNIFAACKRRTTMESPVVAENRQTSICVLKRKAVENDSETNFHSAKRQCYDAVAKAPIFTTPADLAFQLFKENGHDMREVDLVQQLPFTKPTPEMISAYEPTKITLVRKGDLEGVRALHATGASFDACNRFGESLIHMASRRGCKDMVEFLVQEAKVSLFVRDDYGRNVLHDAFWTAEPNFELITLLIDQVPEFLCVRDVRGHTPLDYVRKGDFVAWCDYLRKNKAMLVPRFVNCSEKTSEQS